MDIEELNGSLNDMTHLSEKSVSESFKLVVSEDEEDADTDLGKRRKLSAVAEDFLYGFDNGEAVLGPAAKKVKAEKQEDDHMDIEVETETAEPEPEKEKEPSPSPPPPAETEPVVAEAATAEEKVQSKTDLLLAPFENGWKRELVYRANPDQSRDNKGEVYYISPLGKKCRTRNDISHNLGDDLTIENFSFAKEPLGLSPDKEIVRHAKLNSRNALGAVTPETKPRTPAPSPAIVTGKRVSKPKLPKGASPPPQGWTPTRALKASSTPNPRVLATSRASHDNENKPNAKGQPKERTKTAKKGDGEPCTMQCRLAMGKVPQLQCVKCLCLYHHECVGLDCNEGEFRLTSDDALNGGRKDYVCESCMPIGSSSSNSKDNGASRTNTNSNTPNHQFSHQTPKRQRPASRASSPPSHAKTKKEQLPQSIVVLNNKKYIAIKRPAEIENSAEPAHNEKKKTSKHVEPLPAPVQQPVAQSPSQSSVTYNAANFLGNVALGYDVLVLTFQYLKVQELLRCSRVCRLWNLLANHRNLWRTVRMKNSQVNDWSGFAAALRRNETHHLDLRKILLSTANFDEMWAEFSEHIRTVVSLRAIDFCRCPAKPVQEIFKSNPKLRVINANTIKDDTLDLAGLEGLVELEELRLKSIELIAMSGDLSPLRGLENLRHLSLTSFKDLALKDVEVIGELVNLKSLEFGECNSLKENFPKNVLTKLVHLEALRLESSGDDCCTDLILETVANMEKLTQLELVNFDVRPGFDDKISQCKNIRKLLIIPTYVSQSATTNHVVLKSVLRLADTLDVFTWAVTLELMRVTALYVVQCDEKKKKDKRQFDESIPILKPVPGSGDHDSVSLCTGLETVPQIEILPLENVENILTRGLTRTKFKIIKIAHNATWKQGIVE